MSPRVPQVATGRASLEWHQIVAMRYRDPGLATYGEPADVWDKLRNPDVDEFLTKADYEKILLALENNLRDKGAGRHYVSTAAQGAQHDQRLWDMAHARAQEMLSWDINQQPSASTDETAGKGRG